MGERRRTRRAAAGVAAAALLALAGCGAGDPAPGVVAGVRSGDDDGMHGAVLDEPYTLADATLADTSAVEASLRGRLTGAGRDLTLLFFGYTSCPDICQAVMADLASATARLSAQDAERVQVWFVTTDPARDDPGTLRTYLDRFDPAFEGFTGPLARLVEVARSVHVPIEKGPRLPTGGYDVTHGTPVLAVTPDGQVPMLWTEGTSPARLAADVTALLQEV